MADLVYNIEAASPTMISSLDRHCMKRIPDGSSNIDPGRSHLNRILIGHEDGLSASLKEFFEGGVKRPARQSERPYLRIVLSASPEYFRPEDPEAIGTWNDDRLAEWLEATMGQLKDEHGDDLIFVHLHLDEDTPHLHAVVVPTYLKKPRRPGKRKRGESEEQFEARKQAAINAKGVRAAGRASHPTLSKPDSFFQLRKRMALAVDHLGIEYGEDRQIDAGRGTSTRQWVKNKAAELRKKEAELKRQKAALEVREQELDQREEELEAAQTARLLELKAQRETAEIEANEAIEAHAAAKAKLEDMRAEVETGQKAINDARGEAENILKAARDNAQITVNAAAKSAKDLLDEAEKESSRLIGEEVTRRVEGDRILKSFQAFTNLIREGIETVFGEPGFNRFKKWFDPRWESHPDNVERTVQAKTPTPPPTYSRGPSGP